MKNVFLSLAIGFISAGAIASDYDIVCKGLKVDTVRKRMVFVDGMQEITPEIKKFQKIGKVYHITGFWSDDFLGKYRFTVVTDGKKVKVTSVDLETGMPYVHKSSCN